MITLAEQIAAAKREAAMRRNVYPAMVAAKRLKQAKAAHEIAVMDAIVATLQAVEAEGSHDRA